MLYQLEKELEHREICISELSSITGIPEKTLVECIAEQRDFTLRQMLRIQRVLPGATLDALFRREGPWGK